MSTNSKVRSFNGFPGHFSASMRQIQTSRILPFLAQLKVSQNSLAISNQSVLHYNNSVFFTGLYSLKTVDTICNCQRPVFWLFSLGVSQNTHKITNLWKVRSIYYWSSKLRENDGRKSALSWVLSDAWIRVLKIKFKYFSARLLLSQKVLYFRGCCCS